MEKKCTNRDVKQNFVLVENILVKWPRKLGKLVKFSSKKSL